MQYDYRKLGGGKSGATVYLLSNKSEKFIFKFSEDAVITSTQNGNTCHKNQKSINEMKREKAKSSCTRTMFGTMLCKSDLSNITIYDSELHYIRAIREIYLMKNIVNYKNYKNHKNHKNYKNYKNQIEIH